MSDDRDLAALLAKPPHVDDAGFTDRVMSALPPARRSSRLVYAIVPLTTAAASAASFAFAPAPIALAWAFVALAAAMLTAEATA